MILHNESARFQALIKFFGFPEIAAAWASLVRTTDNPTPSASMSSIHNRHIGVIY